MERADVALIDSLSTVHRGDENSAKDMAKVASAWREASITDGKSVTLLHHFTKLNEPTKPGQSLRGSSAIYAHLRHVLGIRWANEQRTELELRADGNLAHRLEPTLIRLVAGVTAEGRKTVRFEFAGTVQDARAYAIDEAIITILRDAPDGLHGERIRELVRERVGENGVRNSTIDDRLRALSREQRIRRITPRAPWKLLDQ
jgi:hypothetical protein